jgi:hypothetical protein
MFLPLVIVLAASPATSTVTPFRTEVAPRVDPVFPDAAGLRQAVDRFLKLQSEMDEVRAEFGAAVHATLAQLAPGDGHACPAGAGPQYAKAQAAGGHYLTLGRQLEARFREIRRSDDLGESAGLTPDYRLKIKRARDMYQELLRDYREMRVAFYDQLQAEMRHAGCALPAKGRPARHEATATVDPADPAAWTIEEAVPAPAPARVAKLGGAPMSGAAPAIWINIDNSRCADGSQVSLDGQPVGAVSGHKKVSIRAHAGPHDLCVLPTADKKACGDPGTLRRAYLYEGWTLVVRCGGG